MTAEITRQRKGAGAFVDASARTMLPSPRQDKVGSRRGGFRSSACTPCPCNTQEVTLISVGFGAERLAFLVRLFHSLLQTGLSRRFPWPPFLGTVKGFMKSMKTAGRRFSELRETLRPTLNRTLYRSTYSDTLKRTAFVG